MNEYHIHIAGLVQGVGFRPYVYRIATEMGLRGYVDNRNDGVSIVLQSSPDEKERFLKRLELEHPPVSVIEQIESTERQAESPFREFFIAPSRTTGDEITRISPDIAICEECLADRKRQPHRLNYPFINCTHCGPRFSIIRRLPYDRQTTTMSPFVLCERCREEYNNIRDRRFHAQPVACTYCGPHYTLHTANGETEERYERIVALLTACLARGGIAAVKGCGGYNLLCDATDTDAIARLREIKSRYRKPFAVMFPDENSVRRYADVSGQEAEMLRSWRRPIVLLRCHTSLPAIPDGYRSIGAILPYMALHYDLFDNGSPLQALVFTSANRNGEPIVTDDGKAQKLFGQKCDLFVSYNREIYQRSDDSIVRMSGGACRVIRRSRGYTPETTECRHRTEGILAVGADSTSSPAIGKGRQIIAAQYLGSLRHRAVRDSFGQTVERFAQLFRFVPRQIVCDAHPGYYSTEWAETFARQLDIPLLRVQHHHAHAVAVMVEHGIDEETAALCLDGTGYGEDGTIWGGELLLCERSQYTRLSHQPCLPMPGGEAAVREPWRMALALYHTAFGKDRPLPEPFGKRIGHTRQEIIYRMIEQRINTPFSSGAGRLFDAVASLLGIADENSYQGEAPMLLEQIADRDARRCYPIDKNNPLDLRLPTEALLDDLKHGIAVPVIAAAFHQTFAAQWCAEICRKIPARNRRNIILTGGVMQNRLLVEELLRLLRQNGFQPILSRTVPCNDAGISVGQIGIAAARNHIQSL